MTEDEMQERIDDLENDVAQANQFIKEYSDMVGEKDTRISELETALREVGYKMDEAHSLISQEV